MLFTCHLIFFYIKEHPFRSLSYCACAHFNALRICGNIGIACNNYFPSGHETMRQAAS